MTVCANHHRQLHYGSVEVRIGDRAFEIQIGNLSILIPRFTIEAQPDAVSNSLIWNETVSVKGKAAID